MELRVGNRYRLGRKIGSGSFGDIYLGEAPLPRARGHRDSRPPGPSGPCPGDPAPSPRHPRPRPRIPQRPEQGLAAFPASGRSRPPPRAPAPPSGRGVAGQWPGAAQDPRYPLSGVGAGDPQTDKGRRAGVLSPRPAHVRVGRVGWAAGTSRAAQGSRAPRCPLRPAAPVSGRRGPGRGLAAGR